MPKLTINGISLNAPETDTLLEAATGIGISIPTLCHAEGIKPNTSCMICVVEEGSRGRLLPACSARVEEGMVVNTDSETVRHARKTVLELLLSEHQGDCEAPCERACPAGLNIPLMLRHIARGEWEAANALARDALTIPAILGQICTAPCEAACRRGLYDEPVAIRALHGMQHPMQATPENDHCPENTTNKFPNVESTSSHFNNNVEATSSRFKNATGMSRLHSYQSPVANGPDNPPSPKIVSVIGSGPAGLAAAYTLRKYGYTCRVYEKKEQAGGLLREMSDEKLPRAILEDEIKYLGRMGVEFMTGVDVEKTMPLTQITEVSHAVILACALTAPDQPGLFRAEEQRMPVRSVASGKRAAAAVHAWNNGAPAERKGDDYHSVMGRLPREQMDAYVAERTSAIALKRSRNAAAPQEEAERCLHCDCHAPVSCKLRRYAAEYGARNKAFRQAERPLPGGVQRHGEVIFDAGKCIKCGLCVEITRKNQEALGLTFTDRGFSMQVSVPFGEALGKAIARCAQECLAACPTGALVFDSAEERE